MTEDIYLTRDEDHSTSLEAARCVSTTISETMRNVYAVLCICQDGLTDSELREAMVACGFPPKAESTYRKRRTDLMHLGYVVPTGERRMNRSGSPETVWKVSNKNLLDPS